MGYSFCSSSSCCCRVAVHMHYKGMACGQARLHDTESESNVASRVSFERRIEKTYSTNSYTVNDNIAARRLFNVGIACNVIVTDRVPHAATIALQFPETRTACMHVTWTISFG
jgi:hypothetical protein